MNMVGQQVKKNKTLNRRWLDPFGGLIGMRVSDLSNFPDIKKNPN